MQMSNGSPGWEESHLCQAAGTLRLAHSPPGSSPHKLTCLMPPHQDWVHILGAGGCALPEDPRDFSEVHRTPPREGRWSPVTKYIGFGITVGPILTQPLACHGALRKSLHPFSLSFLICDGGTSNTSLGGLSGQLSQTMNVECLAQSLAHSKHSIKAVISELQAVKFGLTWGSCFKQQSC